MKKRLMSLLLSAAMIVSMVVVPAAAADSVTVSVDSVSGRPGETVSVGVNVAGLAEGDLVTAFQIEVPFDAASLEGTAPVATGHWVGSFLLGNLKNGDTATFGGMDLNGWANDGTVCTIEFKIKDDIAVDSVELPITVKSFTLKDGSKFSVDKGNLTAVNGAVTVARPTPTQITVSDDAAVTVAMETQTVAFTASVIDQFGDAMPNAAIEWSISEAAGVKIDANGVVSVDNTALTGDVTVTATSGSVSDTAVLKITRPAPVVNEITASGAESIDVPTAAVGSATVELSATGVDQLGAEIEIDATWSVSEAAGVSVEGNVLTVTNKAQAGTVTVTANVGEVSDSFELTINKAASVPASIAFEAEAATLSIPVGDEINSKTFAVTGVDQFGDEIAVEATFELKGDDYVSAEGNTVSVKKGATAGTQYTLTAKTGEATASIVITVVDIEMTWPTVTVAEDTVYGDTWADIISLSGGSAALDGVNVPGTFSVVDADVVPNAGEQTYTIQFVSDDGNYNVTTTGTAAIAKKAIAADWAGFSGLTYGDEVNVTAEAEVELTVSANTSANAGTYVAKAAIAGDNAANYELTNPEQEYTVAPAEATISVSAQTIRAGKNGEQLAAQIGTVQADGVNGEKVDGTLTVEGDITGYAAGETATVNVSFATENANYVSPIAGEVQVTFTEGDPQEISANDLTATYGDAAASVEAAIVKGGKGEITYASDDESVAVVAADGTVTFVGAGEATISITAAADGDWAATTIERTVTVAPKAVTITGVAAADKVYDADVEAAVVADAAAIDGKVGEDDVTVDASKAEAVFASANAGEKIAVSFSGFALAGADADNYVLSAQPADAAANIAKAAPVISLSGLRQTPNKVKDVTVNVSPASDDVTVKVEYQLPAAEGETEGAWTDTVPQEKGNYPVRVTVSGSANLEDAVDESNTLVVKKKSTPKPVQPEVEEPEIPEVSFTDVAEDDWFYDYVIKAAEQGLFAGDETGAFNPNAQMNRAMIVTVLAAIEFEGKGAPEVDSDFTDLTADWYKNAVAWAASAGITSGLTETEFGPDKAVTREQVAVFLYAYAKSKDIDVSSGEDTNILSYNDAFDISEWAIPAMQWACAEGLIDGTPEGDLMPAGTATRAQVAVILTNFVELLNK